MNKIASVMSLIIICCGGCKEACVSCLSNLNWPIIRYDSIVNVYYDTVLHKYDTVFIKIDTTARWNGVNYLQICPGTPGYQLLRPEQGGYNYSYQDSIAYYRCK